MKYLNYYETMHRQGYFPGRSLKDEYLPILKDMVRRSESTSILDYGCGKAIKYNQEKYHNKIGIEDAKLYLYDPAVPKYSVLTKDDIDGVVCTDVLEHVPEEELDALFETIFSKANKFAFFVIACGLAHAKLPDGSNAHVTVKHPKWWKEKIESHNKNGIWVKYRFPFPKEEEFNILGLTMADTKV